MIIKNMTLKASINQDQNPFESPTSICVSPRTFIYVCVFV